jgi:hypothetical protein
MNLESHSRLLPPAGFFIIPGIHLSSQQAVQQQEQQQSAAVGNKIAS